LCYQLEALTLVVYRALVEVYLVVLTYLLTLMATWVVEVVVDLEAPPLLFLLAMVAVAMSSCGFTKVGVHILI